MPNRNKAKLGLAIPVNPRFRGSFDVSSSSVVAIAALPSPSRRNIVRSIPPPPPAPAKTEREESEGPVNAPPTSDERWRRLSKQLSMRETSTTDRDIAWERRRRQSLRKERRRNSISVVTPAEDPYQSFAAGDGMRLTDADLHDLKGSIELGFGFNEEEGQKLCNTLPALDLYFAVNRKVSSSPLSSPHPPSLPLIKIPSAPQIRTTPLMSPADSPRDDQDSWKICGPGGDDPQQVKTKLRHWAQAVVCSIIQSS